jgi:protein subunit release factor A
MTNNELLKECHVKPLMQEHNLGSMGVELIHLPTGLIFDVLNKISQNKALEQALELLREALNE